MWLLTARAPIPVAGAICLLGKPAYYPAGPVLRGAALEGAALLWAAWREDRPRLMWPVTALCADPHRSGDLGVRQARVIPEHQGFALPGWKGVKGRHEGLRGGDGWLPGPGQRRLAAGQGRAGCMAGSCPDDHFPQQVGQGLIAVPQVPPSAVHGGEGGLDYFFCRGNVDHQESGQPGKGTVVRVIKHGNRLVSIPSGPGRRPGHPGAGRVVSGVAAGRPASVPAARYPWPGGSSSLCRRRGRCAAGAGWLRSHRAEPAQPGHDDGRMDGGGAVHVADRGHTPGGRPWRADRRGCPWPAGRIRSHGDQSAGDRSVSLTGRLDQLAQRGGYLPAARGRELPEDTRKLLLPPRRGLADQMLPGGGELQGHHTAVTRLAAPGDVARSGQPVSEPGHRGGVQAQRPGYLSGPGPPQIGKDREHPELRQGHRAVKDLQAAQRDARQHPRGRLQDLCRLRCQLRLNLART